METHMDEDAIHKLGKAIAKNIKTEADLGAVAVSHLSIEFER